MRLCECGCGQPAPIAKATNRAKGHVKGEPLRFVSGHNQRGRTKSIEQRTALSAYASNRPDEHHAKLAAAAAQRGPVKPAAEVHLSTIHDYLARHFPKANRCEECGAEGATDYAFLKHPEAYTRERADYRELCRSCHVSFDFANGQRSAA